jgi:hypothetical protein
MASATFENTSRAVPPDELLPDYRRVGLRPPYLRTRRRRGLDAVGGTVENQQTGFPDLPQAAGCRPTRPMRTTASRSLTTVCR